MSVKRLLVLTSLLVMAGLVVLSVPAYADPGPTDEVVLILADCDNGTTTASAHNTTDLDLRYIIKIDAVIVDQGTLAPGERVERTYPVKLGESHFFRIRLGLTGDGAYFSDEGTADRTDCPSPTTTTPPTSTPPTSTPPTSTPPTSVSGEHGHKTPSETVKAKSGTRSPGGTAFTGSEDLPWLLAVMLGLLIVGVAALRITSRGKEGR
jgi:hypothetical protein